MKQNYLITLPHEYKEPNHMVSVIGKPGLCGPKPRPVPITKMQKNLWKIATMKKSILEFRNKL